MPLAPLAIALVTSLLSAAEPEPAAEQLGTICYADGTSRRITPDDAVQMAKMIDGETWGSPSVADARAMLWAIAQRSGIWAFPRWTLADLIRAYSQPINPKWTRTGSACRQYYAPSFSGPIPDSCSLRRVERREHNITMVWADLAALARREVLDFAAGKTANPVPGAVGWFAPGMWKKREGNGSNTRDHMVAGPSIDGNVYVKLSSNPDTTAWTADRTRVVGPGQSCAATGQRPATPSPATPSCATNYTYHRTGTISFIPPLVDRITTMVIVDAGTRQGVCADSTGMIFLGDADDAYLTDADGQPVRFKVTAIDTDAATVEITHGTLTRKMLDGNRRVVVRRHK
jgi:hypothetical protein